MQHTTLEGTRELMQPPRCGRDSGDGRHGPGARRVRVGQARLRRRPGQRARVHRAHRRRAQSRRATSSPEKHLTTARSVRPSRPSSPKNPCASAPSRNAGSRARIFFLRRKRKKLARLVVPAGVAHAEYENCGPAGDRDRRNGGHQGAAATRVLIARLDPEQVGREFPLSAEKLSPILAFYAVANLAAGIALCRRLLEFGGLGHTCAIHSQNRRGDSANSAKLCRRFACCVNSSSVHGSIGYSTNLFPAMTLGCGAPGGNITSDNIGPQHLMNVKRIAWESRARRASHACPADQRMASTLRAGGRRGCRRRRPGRREPPRDQRLAATPAAALSSRYSACPQCSRQTNRRSLLADLTERGLRSSSKKCSPEYNIAQASGAAAARRRDQQLIAAGRAGSASACRHQPSHRPRRSRRNLPIECSAPPRLHLTRGSAPAAPPAKAATSPAPPPSPHKRHDCPVRQRKRRAPRDDAPGENLYRAQDHRDALGARSRRGARSLC